MIHRYIEKSLDLGGMELHGEYPVRPGALQQRGDQLGRDRHPGPVLPVLAGVAIVGQHRRDPVGRGALESVDHQQQLHQIRVHRRAGGLHHKHIGAPHILPNLDIDLPVGKCPDGCRAKLTSQAGANLFRQGGVGVSGEDFK